eukprot:4424746-Amphidinium_carterae.1
MHCCLHALKLFSLLLFFHLWVVENCSALSSVGAASITQKAVAANGLMIAQLARVNKHGMLSFLSWLDYFLSCARMLSPISTDKSALVRTSIRWGITPNVPLTSMNTPGGSQTRCLA